MVIFDSGFDLPAQVYEVVIFGLSAAFLLLAGWISRNLSRIGELERSREHSRDRLEAQETAAQEAEDRAKNRVEHLERDITVYAILLGDARQRLATERLAAENLFHFSLSEIQDLESRVARAEAPAPRSSRSVNPCRDPIFDLLFGSASAAPKRPGHWTWRTVKAGDPIFDALFGSGAADTNAASDAPDPTYDPLSANASDAKVDTKVDTKVDVGDANASDAKVNVEESMRAAFSRLRQPRSGDHHHPDPSFGY